MDLRNFRMCGWVQVPGSCGALMLVLFGSVRGWITGLLGIVYTGAHPQASVWDVAVRGNPLAARQHLVRLCANAAVCGRRPF